MGAKIITKYESGSHNGEGPLSLDFDKTGKQKLYLEMTVTGAPAHTEIIWEVYSNSGQLDIGDLTRGKKAEFILLKSYAGPPDAPRIFTIVAKDQASNILARQDISVFATPEITEAYWGDSLDNKIYEAVVNHSFTAYFKGFGLYNIPLTVRFFLKSADNNDVEVTDFSRTVYMTTEYDLTDFYIDRQTLKDNFSFFLRNAPRIILDYISGKNLLSITGQKRDTVIAKAYFTITYGDRLLFHGKHADKLLDVTFNITSLFPSDPITNISPVTVSDEEYFTQRYEPCKYEQIFLKNGDDPEQKIFDEKVPVRKNPDKDTQKHTIHVFAIVPPKGSRNSKALEIRLKAVDTEYCSLTDQNKQLTTFSEDSLAGEKQPHQGRVIDTGALDEANIDYSFEKPDEKIIIKPSFDYRYDKDSAWEFLTHYFLFSSALSNRDMLHNQVKGALMDWEAASKGIIDVHRIGLETCRYRKGLYLHTYADVAWAFHALFDDPYVPEYYNDNKKIKTIKGLDEELDWIRDNPMVGMFSAPILGNVFGISIIRNFILDILKDMAKRYEFGFTAYYDFDKQGKKNDRQIDYAETHPNVFKGLIAGAVTLEVLIDVILIIITEGAALANFISKAGKVAKMVKRGDKIITAGKRADDLLTKYSGIAQAGRYGRITKNTLEFMKGSYYRGYRFVADEKIGVQPVLEERVKISPLINVGITTEKSLGQLLLDMSPGGMILNMARSANGGFELGVSRIFLDRIKYRKINPVSGHKETVEIGKQGTAWYRAATYPLRIINYALDGVYKLAAFTTDEALRVVFGADAEFEKDVTGHIDLDFWLKIHNAEKKLDLISIASGDSKKDKSSISVGTSAGLTVRLKLSGSVSNKVAVRAMHIFTWDNKDPGIQEVKADGRFEVEGNVFVERRYFFEANKKAPYYEDKAVFTGLAGEYEYKVKTTGRDNGGIEDENIIQEQEPRQFMLLEPCQLIFNSSEMTKNPSE